MFNKGDNIEQSGDNNLAIQNSEVTVIVSPHESLSRLAKMGKYQEAAELLKNLMDNYGKAHPYYPHYSYKVEHEGNKMFVSHEPRSIEDSQKFPLEYQGEFKIINENLDKFNNVKELVNEAFLNQRDIEIDMVSFRALIAGNEVETPFLEENTREGKWVIKPNPLPDSVLTRIQLSSNKGSVTLIEYAEVNIGQFDKDKLSVTMDNSRQVDALLYVSLTIPRESIDTKSGDKARLKNVKFNFAISKPFVNTVSANLHFSKMLRKVSLNLESNLEFVNLKTGKFFMSSIGAFPTINQSLEEIDKDINFLERLLKVEEYFQISFDLPETMSDSDFETLVILESIIAHKPLRKRFEDLIIDVTSRKEMNQLISAFENEEEGLGLRLSSTPFSLELFGAKINIEKSESAYQSLKAKNLEKLKRKYVDMEDGELVKFVLIPAGSDLIEETYFPKEKR
ncbi:abortive infection system toxin AbiGii family protein [Planomicrobium okeanokoites]|uniref:abortive infection system toxin AbiGii family protein n=1 Tax=Planomicrobium okeanokoites TaxID=244 RepID=UPI0009FC719C|nr:abortive infection system toxin AbiGii family protein [Planomicrobium okeanokoites]